MTTPLTPASRILLRRLARSLSPWRVAALPAVNGPAMIDLEARGLVERQRGIYRLTAAGQSAESAEHLPH